MKSYAEKLQSPLWQKKRLFIFMRDNWACVKCKSADKTLHVHHKQYISGADPWSYPDYMLETLCFLCHKREHNLIPEAEAERKYEHLIMRRQPNPVLDCITSHISSLQNKLKEEIPQELQEEILKNLMFLMDRRKEFLA